MEHLTLLEPLDISTRIEELKLLKQGWLDGKGLAPSQDGLAWLAEAFGRSYPDNVSPPYLFPTPEGRVLAEWSLKPWSPSLEIDLSTKQAEWHALNLDTDQETTNTLDLKLESDWKWLAEQISKMRAESE